jgi:hypothetical protein
MFLRSALTSVIRFLGKYDTNLHCPSIVWALPLEVVTEANPWQDEIGAPQVKLGDLFTYATTSIQWGRSIGTVTPGLALNYFVRIPATSAQCSLASRYCSWLDSQLLKSLHYSVIEQPILPRGGVDGAGDGIMSFGLLSPNAPAR